MNSKIAHALAAVVALTSSSAALAQVIVGPERKVNPVGQQWRECFIAARKTNASKVVVCGQGSDPFGGAGTHAAVTLNGGTSFTNTHFPHPTMGDTGVAVDPLTDRIWFSTLSKDGALSTEQYIQVAWNEPASATFSPLYTAVTFGFDKPLMAIGLFPSGGTVSRHYLLYSGPRMLGDPPQTAWASSSNTPTDGLVWEDERVQPDPAYPEVPDYEGWGAMPVVLNSGRVVVVYRDTQDQYNDGLPIVVYSDDGGLDWKPDFVNPALPVRVAEGSGIEAPVVTDYPVGINGFGRAPSIAVDPSHPDHVYVAFYARSAPGTTNTDIYVSRSINGGQSFPGGLGDLNLLRLSDELLEVEDILPTGPDQVMPAIVIDGCGGVNLHFYDTRHDEPSDSLTCIDVYYVRITGFGTANPVVYRNRLTANLGPFQVNAGTFLGHYHGMALAGPPTKPTIYPAYIRTSLTDCPIPPGNPPDPLVPVDYDCYIHKIRVVCLLSDFNGNGVADPQDPELFIAAYLGAEPAADLDEDQFVDALDSDLFWESYLGE